MKDNLTFVILLVFAAIVFDFLLLAGAYWVVCWAFSLSFSWKIAFGIWFISICIFNFIKRATNHE